MLSKEEAQRIAAAVNAHRPDWSVASVLAVLRNERLWKLRTYRDTALAFTWVATDSTSEKPTRILADGPWWQVSKPLGEASASAHIRPLTDTDCAICNRPRELCLRDGHEYAAHHDFGFGTPMPDEVRERLAEVAEATHLAATAEREAELEEGPPAPATEVVAKHTHTHPPTQEAR